MDAWDGEPWGEYDNGDSWGRADVEESWGVSFGEGSPYLRTPSPELWQIEIEPHYAQKRSHDDMEPSGVVEPAWKRPALPTRLPARVQDVVDSGDVDMGETSNICSSTPNKVDGAGSGSLHTCPENSTGLDEASKREPFSTNYWRLGGSVHEYVMKHLSPRSDGSYSYASCWTPSSSGVASSGTPNVFKEKSIQDMRLAPSMTFFHINEMIVAKKLPFTGGAVYELFARVVNYGCADFPPHYQYFQLEDLFGGQPYLSGLLMRFQEGVDRNKQRGCSVECEATQFAGETKSEGKCYCLCEPVEDNSSEFGYSIYIREIRPVTWETIRSVHAQLRK